MDEKSARHAKAFNELLLAAMCDAAVEHKMTQLKATITPKGCSAPRLVRIIVVPESMEVNRVNPVEMMN